MSVARLTKEKLRDARFRKTEEAIFKVFFGELDERGFSVNELIQKIGIDRATFYRHHRTTQEVIKDYEKYILEEYNILMNGVKNGGEVSLRKMYCEMLTFILRNQQVFVALVGRKELMVIKEMILGLEPEIMAFVRISDESGRILKVYMGEVVGLVEDWGMNGFDGAEMVKLLNNIMYLTNTAGDRLLPLAN